MLRRIQPMPFPDLKVPDLGDRPRLEWVSPTDLYVDETYQRDLGRRSMVLITKMISEFSWARMKPPIVVLADGHYHVIDGQHTALVAASLGIDAIPVFIVQAEGLDERARAFVGHNTDRVTVQPVAIYKALVAAGDPDAVDIQRTMERAGVRLRHFSPTVELKVGDTAAIGIVRRLVKVRGPMKARMVLETLVKAKRAPISAHEIKAVEHVLCVATPDIDQERLARIIRIDGDAGFMAAQSHSKVGKIPVWKALIERWRRSLKDV